MAVKGTQARVMEEASNRGEQRRVMGRVHVLPPYQVDTQFLHISHVGSQQAHFFFM